MGIFGDSKKNAIDEGAVAAEKRPLLQTGAILVYANEASGGWKPQTLKLDQKKLSAKDVLDGFWGVGSKEDANNRIEDLISGGGLGLALGSERETRESIDGRLARYTKGEQSALSGAEAGMLDKIVKLLTGYKFNKVKLTREVLDSVATTLAWDIERAAFIARLAYNVGYFTEEEAWKILDKTRKMAAEHFGSWRDYAISFMKGRAIVMCDSDYSNMTDIWANVCLLAEPKWGEVWTWSEIK